MNKDKELELHGTPKALYDRVRGGLEGETQRAGLPLHVGGGGVLEARWDHRESLDIDVVIPTDNPDAARSALNRAAEQSGGYRVQGPGFDRIEFPDRPQEEHVDVGFSQPTPATGVEHSSVNGRPAEVLNSTQIMTAKLTHRGLNAPVRDVFDVAVCARIEPRALEAAVNARTPNAGAQSPACTASYQTSSRTRQAGNSGTSDRPSPTSSRTRPLQARRPSPTPPTSGSRSDARERRRA